MVAGLSRLRCIEMVRLFFTLNGKRYEETVPFHHARHRNKQLFLAGAAVYWSELC